MLSKEGGELFRLAHDEPDPFDMRPFEHDSKTKPCELRPKDICSSSLGNGESGTARQGTGPCGYNSLCEIMKHGRPNCTCPPGFSLLNENNPFMGCKQDYTSYPDYWKKKSPLFNGLFESNNADGKLLYKVLKSSPKTKQNPAVLIPSNLFGTSTTFNFLSLATIALIFFCLYQRQLGNSKSIPSFLNCNPSRGDLETNLRSFAYKDLERATSNFKEEIRRGGFGTVYKGELPSRYLHHVAVKKLEKLAQDDEKEFMTEVEVIGQTHHKSLVRLLGYCNEG
ncbi:hypothetical protein PTKIN_Ptkin14bG0042400 [Pterospermum kingtungense]